jgi:opacity protein-like surface antigen
MGYQFNSFLRGDVTGTMWSRKINGNDTHPAVCDVTNPIGTTCRSEDSTKVSAYEVMANAYADLGTFVGVTPYLGAGLGMTRLSYDNLTNTSYYVDAAGHDAGVFNTAVHPGENSWRFTWALMAGASYDISKNLKFDLGYRYSRVQGGDMFGFDAASVRNGASGLQGRDNGFSSHEIKAGVRYSLW